MPMPDNGAAWPPAQHARGLADMAEWSAWYSGDPTQLTEHYRAAGRGNARVRPAQRDGGVVGRVARWWWGTPVTEGQASTKLHVPLAADICGTSADLLFSEAVKLGSDSTSLADMLEQSQEAGLDAKLHEGAEVTAGLGGSYLRVCWDARRGRLPWTDVVHGDRALPEWQWGQLAAVTFWQVLPGLGSGGATYRLLERHSPGRIDYALFVGRSDNLGSRAPLEDHPDAAHLAVVVDALSGVPTGTGRLTATYVPNMRPNRANRGSLLGRSDLQGVTPFLDALDEAYSSWWRDIRHAKSRLIMPASYLGDNGPGQPGTVDLDRDVYVPLEGVLGSREGGLAIEAQQFAIRVAEHRETCEAWTTRIIESAGYSTQSLSSGTGGAVTAAEVHSHERRSYMTRGKKVRYWKSALRDHLMALVDVANANLSAGIVPGDLSIEFEDGVQESAMQLAQTAQAMRNAEAASIRTRVQLVHPQLDSESVDREVAMILAETQGTPVPMPDDAGL